MPTYHYECAKCGTTFDVKLPFGSKELPPCPNCGATDVRKLIKPPLISFKGTGFYKTDSRSAPAAKPAESKPAEPAKPTAPPPAAPSPAKDA